MAPVMLQLLILALYTFAHADTISQQPTPTSYPGTSQSSAIAETVASTGSPPASSRPSILIGSPILVSGCLPITPTTTLLYPSGTSTVYTTTSTSTRSLTTDNEVVITSYNYVTGTTAYQRTVTSTWSDSTISTLVVLPAATTVTQPVAPWFTPVLCDQVFYQYQSWVTEILPTTTVPIVLRTTVYVPSSVTRTLTYLVDSTIATSTYTASNDATEWTEHVITVTRSEATRTIFEACASKNIAGDSPFGRYVEGLKPKNDDLTGLPKSVFEGVLALDAVDCCALCQKNGTCIGSAYNLPECQLWFKAPALHQTCEIGFDGAVGYLTGPSPNHLLSNSPCGQWQYDNTA